MEDILEVYKRPYNTDTPLVCMDETTKQLTKETRSSIPAKHGRPARIDHEYERNGVCNLFMFYEPFGGKRYVSVTDRRTKIDWAIQIKKLFLLWIILTLIMEPHYTKFFHHTRQDDC